VQGVRKTEVPRKFTFWGSGADRTVPRYGAGTPGLTTKQCAESSRQGQALPELVSHDLWT